MMYTDEERIKAMHHRASEMRKKQRRRNVRILQGVSVACCFAIVVVIAVFASGGTGLSMPVHDPGSMSASIFSGGGIPSFVVIGIIAFLLGVVVTIFCFRLKVWQERKNTEDDKW